MKTQKFWEKWKFVINVVNIWWNKNHQNTTKTGQLCGLLSFGDSCQVLCYEANLESKSGALFSLNGEGGGYPDLRNCLVESTEILCQLSIEKQWLEMLLVYGNRQTNLWRSWKLLQETLGLNDKCCIERYAVTRWQKVTCHFILVVSGPNGQASPYSFYILQHTNSTHQPKYTFFPHGCFVPQQNSRRRNVHGHFCISIIFFPYPSWSPVPRPFVPLHFLGTSYGCHHIQFNSVYV